MNTLILNDIHLGFSRAGGTTPESRQALAEYLRSSLEKTLSGLESTHVVVMGDLFDDFTVDTRYVLDAYNIFNRLLDEPTNSLTLVAGNHDHNPRGDKVSSFNLLCGVLDRYSQFQSVKVGGVSADISGTNVFVAHHANQELFDPTLQDLLTTCADGDNVFLHANYDNNFAVESDHSLNVSADVASAFRDKGVKLFFAHEHQAREVNGVTVMGNQWPTSVSDCLNNDAKFFHICYDGEEEFKKVQTWSAGDAVAGFSRVPWLDLKGDGPLPSTGFVRFEGTATMTDAGNVVTEIAAYRRKNPDVFVVTSSVAVEGAPKADVDLPQMLESTKGFDVWSFMKGHFTEEEYVALEKMR